MVNVPVAMDRYLVNVVLQIKIYQTFTKNVITVDLMVIVNVVVVINIFMAVKIVDVVNVTVIIN